MRGLDRIPCLIWLGLGVFFTVGSRKYGIGSLDEPGPGFFPMIGGVLLCLAALSHLVQLMLKPEGGTRESGLWVEAHWGRSVVVVAGLVLYAFSVDLLGFIIATFLLMFVLFSLYDRTKYIFAILGSLSVTTITYFVFSIWLKVQFPAGILRRWGV
jgi:putative tricarboxylic transport membrane protein